MKVNRGKDFDSPEAADDHASRFERYENIYMNCCDITNESNVLDLNNEINVDFHKGDMT